MTTTTMELHETEFDEQFRSYIKMVAKSFRMDAEDLLQEVALKMLASTGPSDAANMGPWKRAIVRNTAITALRRRDSRAFINGKGTCFDYEATRDSQPGPVDNVLAAERDRLLVEHIRSLQKMDFEVLNDFYCNGLLVKEIAAKYGIPIGTAKRRLHVARQRLEESWIQKYGDPNED